MGKYNFRISIAVDSGFTEKDKAGTVVFLDNGDKVLIESQFGIADNVKELKEEIKKKLLNALHYIDGFGQKPVEEKKPIGNKNEYLISFEEDVL